MESSPCQGLRRSNKGENRYAWLGIPAQQRLRIEDAGHEQRPSRGPGVEVMERYAVQFVLKEPFVWLVDTLAVPSGMWSTAPKMVQQFGDLK